MFGLGTIPVLGRHGVGIKQACRNYVAGKGLALHAGSGNRQPTSLQMLDRRPLAHSGQRVSEANRARHRPGLAAVGKSAAGKSFCEVRALPWISLRHSSFQKKNVLPSGVDMGNESGPPMLTPKML